MIYQCYYKKDQEPKLFREPAYGGFGIEPEVNSRLFENCPELESAENRLQLTEYACFLWYWRNRENPDTWFGTTSHRQLEKFNLVFADKKVVEQALEQGEIIGWGHYQLLNDDPEKKVGNVPLSLKDQADICHPKLSAFIEFVFDKFGHTVPAKWCTETSGFFANYWVMRNELFYDFMEFSWPMVSWVLENVKDTDYYRSQHAYRTVSNAKSTGYFMERLFILWYLIRDIKPLRVGEMANCYHWSVL